MSNTRIFIKSQVAALPKSPRSGVLYLGGVAPLVGMGLLILPLLVSGGCGGATSAAPQSPPTQPQFSLSLTTFSFPNTTVGSTSTALVVTVSSVGTRALQVSSVAESDLTDFPGTNSCVAAGNISPGSTCTISITFKPSALGSLTCQVTVATNAGNGTISLSGSASSAAPASLSVSPSSAAILTDSTQQFSAIGTLADGSTQDFTNSVTWSSSQGSTLTISNSGLATGVEVGGATITATLGSLTSSANVSVENVQLASNETDPLLFEAQAATGQTIDYFGQKSDQGLATSATSYAVRSPDDSVVAVFLDSQDRPVEVQTADGSVFEISWQSATAATITAISADGTARVTVTVDSANPTAMQKALLPRSQSDGSSTSAPCRTATPEANVPNAHSLKTAQSDRRPHGSSEVVALDSLSSSTITVTQCDSPVDDAIVSLEYILSTTEFSIPALPAGNGSYSVTIPVPDPNASADLQDKCEAAASYLGGVCQANEALTPILPIACSAIAAVNPLLGAACATIGTATELACNTIGWGPSGPQNSGAPSVADFLCSNLENILDRSDSGPITLQPSATIPGQGEQTGSAVSVPGTGPFPSFAIQFPGQVSIASFSADPPNPVAMEGYVATAQILCAPPGTTVDMSIVGTDGYTGANSCVIQGNQSCSLSVPGAALSGIVDTVTVQVEGGPSSQLTVIFQ